MTDKSEISKELAKQSQEAHQKLESGDRRKAVGKLVYASPVLAGILFSQRAAAQFTPPPPPG